MIRFLLVPIFFLMAALFLVPGSTGATRDTAQIPKEPPVEVPSHRVLPLHKHTEACEETTVEPVQIVCILDRSGSMSRLVDDTIGGYNSFLTKQRQEQGEAQVTTVLFDDKYEKIVDAANLMDTPQLTRKEYSARGMTALLDAIGRTVMDTAGQMEKKDICPAKRRVLFLIMTDGQENYSKEYSKDDVKSMIDTATKDYGWNFIFMGANIDSVAEAKTLGIDADHAADYSHDSKGIQKTFDRMNAAASEMRETGSVSADWKN